MGGGRPPKKEAGPRLAVVLDQGNPGKGRSKLHSTFLTAKSEVTTFHQW